MWSWYCKLWLWILSVLQWQRWGRPEGRTTSSERQVSSVYLNLKRKLVLWICILYLYFKVTSLDFYSKEILVHHQVAHPVRPVWPRGLRRDSVAWLHGALGQRGLQRGGDECDDNFVVVVLIAIEDLRNYDKNDNSKYYDNLIVLLARGDFREEVINVMTTLLL